MFYQLKIGHGKVSKQVFDSQVKLPDDYFSKSKKEYTNWLFCWWREVIQNSVDGGAANIELFYEHIDNNKILLRCRDDGTGMTEDVLRNVFLALGGTDKGTDKTGGFGYAKVIILFAHLSYKIKTLNCEVNGAGGLYSLIKTNDYYNGTDISVVIDSAPALENKHYTLRDFEDQLDDLLYYSDIKNVNFFINGSRSTHNKAKFDYKFNTDLGLLSFSDSDEDHSKLMIRINGLGMFFHESYRGVSGFIGVLDLNLPSVEVLTSNRDSLIREYGIKLNNITSRLSTERAELKLSNLTSFVLNPNFETNYHYNKLLNNLQSSSSVVNIDIDTEASDPFLKLKKEAKQTLFHLRTKLDAIYGFEYPENFTIKTVIHNNNESLSSSKKKISDLTRKLSLKRTKKLAWVWHHLIITLLSSHWFYRHGIEPSGDGMFGGTGLSFSGRDISTGFVYSNDVDGLNTMDSNRIIILLNPDAIPIEKDHFFEDILDIAIHEVTHLLVSGHSAEFCSMEMDFKKSLRRFFSNAEIKRKCLSLAKADF